MLLFIVKALLDFDIVIATRNRHAALKLSLPLMFQQDRQPKRLIVVDSSDNNAETKAVVETAARAGAAKVDVQVYPSQAGTSLQRNLGLEHAASPVVFFPDDDSLWFPGVASSIMRIYERDGRESIGGVRAEESFTPPLELTGTFGVRPYDMAFRDRLQLQVGRLQYRLEKRFFPDPLFAEGNSRYGTIEAPPWLDSENAFLCGPMFGFSMSFRADIIKKTGFDPLLGRYALFEDLDASLSVLGSHLLVCSRNARVFHYRAPESRVNGKEWGMMHILNRVYVLCKHSPPGSRARRLQKRFNYYKLTRYLLQAYTPYGRERLAGAWRATVRAPKLMKSAKGELAERYVRLRQECLEG